MDTRRDELLRVLQQLSSVLHMASLGYTSAVKTDMRRIKIYLNDISSLSEGEKTELMGKVDSIWHAFRERKDDLEHLSDDIGRLQLSLWRQVLESLIDDHVSYDMTFTEDSLIFRLPK
ncbi:MAG TPA: hypothetical protein VFX02_03725 [Gammaproteobacteria bacterium]|nr:hypothetical protein [Gammaproteobacteria bacterium]